MQYCVCIFKKLAASDVSICASLFRNDKQLQQQHKCQRCTHHSLGGSCVRDDECIVGSGALNEASADPGTRVEEDDTSSVFPFALPYPQFPVLTCCFLLKSSKGVWGSAVSWFCRSRRCPVAKQFLYVLSRNNRFYGYNRMLV